MIEKNSDVYNRTPEWVHKAIFDYLKSSGYLFPEYYDCEIHVFPDGGATITIIGKTKPGKVKKSYSLINRFLEWAHNFKWPRIKVVE